MNGRELFEAVRVHWPDAIAISGDEDPEFNSITFDLQEEIFERFGKHGLLAAAVWPFHQALHEAARKARSAAAEVVLTQDVEFARFELNLREALDDPSWATEREELN